MASGLTHSISGFAALYVLIGKMAPLEKRDIPVTLGILLGFCLGAWIANTYLDTNYMFLVRGDGTPYDILLNLLGGHPILYPLSVIALFFLYITGFYSIHFFTKKKEQV